jgi:nicotinamidase-related amidase
MLKSEKTALTVVDVQGKLAQMMSGKQALFENLQKIIKGIQALGIPILWVEQNPEGLGSTIPEVSELLAGVNPISKSSFSCCKNERFIQALKAANCNQILMVGIEAHICVYQTAMDLVKLGYEVEVVTDAVSSRTIENKNIALQKMSSSGISLTSTEMALFELLEAAEGEQFKEILKIVK